MMSLYRCASCGTVENTALGSYWEQQRKAAQRGLGFNPRCSECFGGVWHNVFPKETVTAGAWMQDRQGFLYRADRLDQHKSMGPFEPIEVSA